MKLDDIIATILLMSLLLIITGEVSLGVIAVWNAHSWVGKAAVSGGIVFGFNLVLFALFCASL